MIITGIGSRETPENVMEEMTKIGQWCLQNNVTLRSGHADGADWAFEKGAQERCIAYLPWDRFNDVLKSNAKLMTIPNVSRYDEITDTFHPNPRALSKYARKLMNRNACQVLGLNLDKPTNYVICWTKNGELIGGTSQACRIAIANNIPIFNMFFDKYNLAEKIIPMLR